MSSGRVNIQVVKPDTIWKCQVRHLVKRDHWLVWMTWAKRKGHSLREIENVVRAKSFFRKDGRLMRWSPQTVSDELKRAQGLFFQFSKGIAQLWIKSLPIPSEYDFKVVEFTPKEWPAGWFTDYLVKEEMEVNHKAYLQDNEAGFDGRELANRAAYLDKLEREKRSRRYEERHGSTLQAELEGKRKSPSLQARFVTGGRG